MQHGVIKATLVSNLIAGFQSALYQVGRIVGSEDGDEAEVQKIEGICTVLGLNLVATAPGSFVLAMDLAGRNQPTLFEQYDNASSTVTQLINRVNELSENSQDYTGDRPVLRGLRKVATLVKDEVETIEVVYRDEQHYAEAV